MAFGWNKTGYEHKRQIDIENDIEADWISKGYTLGLTKVMSMIIGIFSAPLAQTWEQFQLAYWAMDPDQSPGVLLENLSSIVKIKRIKESKSTVTLAFLGADGTAIPIGTKSAVAGSGDIFVTIEAGVINSVGVVLLNCEAENSGPVVGLSGTITEKVSSISGWDFVTNTYDAVVGSSLETDSQLRVRRNEDKQAAGHGVLGAIRAKVRQELQGVIDVNAIQNFENFEVNGQEGKSIEVVVSGGDDSEIAQLIFDSVPLGLKTVSTAINPADTVTETVTDMVGNSHQVVFSRFRQIQHWVLIEISASYILSESEKNSVAAIALQIGNSLSPGNDVAAWRFEKSVNNSTVQGVRNITNATAKISTDGVNFGSGVELVKNNEIASFDSSRISVVQT